MLTAILPIRREKNRFWDSDRGLACIDQFLNICTKVSGIDQYVVLSKDDHVRRLAKQQGMKVSTVSIPGSIESAYTFDDTFMLAREFVNLCVKKTDALVLLDHRNLLLSADDIINACSIYGKTPENAVAGIHLCRDYPCQYKSFFNFLDCAVIPLEKKTAADEGRGTHPRTITRHMSCCGNVSVELLHDHLLCRFDFEHREMARDGIAARIIPYGEWGLFYERCREHLIRESCGGDPLQLDTENADVKGIVLILTIPARRGEYDTVEVFTPSNATWELGGPGSEIVSIDTGEPMTGRQQYPPIFTYDGSLCLLGPEQLKQKGTVVPTPLILKESCIVTDWVDYWYTESVRGDLETNWPDEDITN